MRLYLFLLLLAIFACNVLYAQDNNSYLYNKYAERYIYNECEPASFLIDKRILKVRPVKDSLFVQVYNDHLLQQLIDLNYNNKIYAIEIGKTDSTDLEKCFELLQQFPKLEYLKFSESGSFGPPTLKPYSLPGNIEKLQQIKGIELYATRSLNVNNALTEFTKLRQLALLSISYTNYKWSADLSILPHLKIVKCEPEQLLNLSTQNLDWEIVNLIGTREQHDNDKQAIEKLSGLHHLKQLDLTELNLSDLKPVFNLKSLTGLKLTFIETYDGDPNLFEQLSSLKQLKSLTVRSFVDIAQNITAISKLKQLRQLSLSSVASLTQHQDILNSLKNLETLSIQGNNLTALPSDIFKLPHLKYLDASSNKIEALPQSGNPNKKLIKINLRYNALKSLPTVITSLRQLKYLDVSNNAIDSIPVKGWDHLTQLQYANFSVNKLKYYPGGLQKITGLKTLNLSDNNLTVLPDFELKQYQLTTLTLSGNKLEHLPEHIGQLSNLESLHVDGNNLADLPQSLGNCTQLKVLDCHTQTYLQAYNASKPDKDRFTIVKDGVKRANHISALPAGLAHDAQLENLNLANNAGIDEQSIFTVILSKPRPHFNVNLSGTGIKGLPASTNWSTMSFADLNLSKNKLTTLPADFASIPVFNEINLKGNPFIKDQAVFDVSVKTPGDMKIVFETLGVPVTNIIATNAQYSSALIARSSAFYSNQEWAKVIRYAELAKAADSTTYNKTMQFDEIGISHFKLNDYTGAIADFKKYGAHEEKVFAHWKSSLVTAENYEANAYLALKQPEKAAEAHIYFAKKHGSETGYQEAAILYLSSGNSIKARQWLDTALAYYQLRHIGYEKQKYQDPAFIFNYAEVLLIAGKPEKAIQIIKNQDTIFIQPQYIPIKNYLLASAKYFTNPANYEELKANLIASTKTTGKVTGWSYDMFNSWLAHSGKSKAAQEAVLALQQIVK